MAYLTCTKHRSYQRKHVDVCRQCPDNEGCDAFQAYAATEPAAPVEPSPVSEPAETSIPITGFLLELRGIRELVADAPTTPEKDRVPARKKPLQGIEWADFIRTELGEIRKLC